jgi:hypothetical protein
MKAHLQEVERTYYKKTTSSTTSSWTLPNLTAETSKGFKVTDNGNKGGPAWKACATTSGYKTGYYSGRYADESPTTYKMVIQYVDNAGSIIVTGYTYYAVRVNASSDETTAWKSGRLYGSNNGSSWTQLHSHGKINKNTTCNYTFSNTKAYTYYKYELDSQGDDFRDQVNVASFHLKGTITTTGGGVVVSDETDYDYYVDTYSINGFNKTHRNYQVFTNIPDATLVGNLSYDYTDKILSGFSADSYLTLDANKKSVNNAEYFFTFKTGNDITTMQEPAHCMYLFDLLIQDGYLKTWNWETSSSGGEYAILPNTVYEVKVNINHTGAQYYIKTPEETRFTLYSDMEDNTLKTNQTHLITLGNWSQSNSSGTRFFTGEIYLDRCYIKINDVLVWRGLKGTPYKLGQHANGEIIGSLSENNGILSNFSADNYFKTTTTFIPGSSPWEINLKITTGSDVTTKQWICSETPSAYSTELLINTDKTIIFQITEDGTANAVLLNSSYTISPGITYWLKGIFDGTKYILKYSLDGTNYTVAAETESSILALNDLNFYLGADWSGSVMKNPFLGSIDLSGCNFKVDNNIVWNGLRTDTEYDFYDDEISSAIYAINDLEET